MKLIVSTILLSLVLRTITTAQQNSDCSPLNLEFWTGRVDYYGKYDDDIKIGKSTLNLFRSWAKFSISGIPDNANICQVDLSFEVITASGEPGSHEIKIGVLTNDPSVESTSRSTIWNEIPTSSYVLCPSCGDSPGGKNLTNLTTLESIIQSSLNKNWVALSFYEENENADNCLIAGRTSIQKPKLKIYYDLPAPSDVSASDGTYCDRVVIRWNSVALADRYYIYRGSTLIGSTGQTTFEHTGASTIEQNYYVYAACNYPYNNGSHSSLSGSDSGYKGSTPSVTSVAGGGAQCGGSRTLTASGGTGGTIYYQGTTSNGTSTSTPSTSVNVAASGTYYFRARSSAGCWGEQGSATVTINPVPSNTAVSGGGSFPVSATLTASGGTGGTIYFQGTTSNGTSTAIPATSRTVTASGTYYFRSRSSAGCWGEQGSASVTITSGSGIGSVTGKTPLCIGESATYTANNVVLEGGTGAWSSSNPAIATVSSTGAVTGVSPGACNIIYTITGGTSGTVSEQQQVTISPDGSIASISGPVDWCVGGVGNYTANSVNLSGGTGAWSSSNSGIISISSSGEATAVSAGQANITYTITGGCGGTISKSLAVTVSSGKAVTSVTGLKSICVNTTTPFVANGVVTAGGQAAWSSSDVTVATVTQTGSVTGLSEGVCNIIYTISGGCGETVSAQQSLSVAPKPVGGTVSLSICSDIALNYNLQSNVNTLGNSIPSTFTWTVASSPEVTGAAASSTAKNIIADRLRNISGNDEKVVYTITPTAINGCKGDPFTLTATIKPEPAGADDAVVTCSDNALDYDLQEDNINIKGNGVSSAFTWTAAANTAVSGFSGSTMTSAIIADNIRNVSGTEQTIIYSVTPTGINGCVGEQFTISAKIQPAPVIILKWGDILICSNKQNLYTSYKWMKNNIPVSGAAGQYYPTDKKAGTYRVQTVDKNGCSSMSNEISVSGSGSLHVFPNPASRTVIFSLDDEPAGTARISLVNAAGMKLREYQVEKTSRQWEKEIPVDDLDEGIYFLTITIGRENVYYSKLLIRRE